MVSPTVNTAATGVGGNLSTPETPSSRDTTVPTSRVDRLLRERIRKSRSAQALDSLEEWDKWKQDLVPLERDLQSSGRLIVIANRLPVTCSKDQQGRWKLQISAGGLVSALMGVNNYSTIWIGWPGIYVKPGPERVALTAMLQKEGYLPVWLESGLLDLYYNGFCNSVLWQLFHYVPLQLDGWQRVTEHQTLQMQWGAYQQANVRFSDVVLRAYQPGDKVWVQDYHLMLLPSLLKAVVPKMKVGWFLHTPFPSSEIYRTLPFREEVLRSVLKADLIGFHTYDYARHFISSCTRILGLEGTPEGVEDNGSVARVAAFPIGIDPERFSQAMETEEVQMNIAKLLNRYAGRKVMLGVDRLDMIKGIPQKLLAFEKFLHEHPEWRDKVLLVQIAVPSRTDVPEYQKLRSMVHEIVGRINGAFGTLTYVPIHHLDRQLSFHELCALYAVTDVALITSLRDGMNLVSYEYVACQSDNAGVLVLSEFAGAAQSLGAGSILVNPWNINDVAAAIEDALTMSEEERRERHRQNYMHVATHTAQTWADTFISELNDTHIEADLRLRHTPPELDIAEVVRAYKASKRRLIVLGYNATLTTAVEAPRQPKRHFDQIKALTRVNPRIMRCLEELSRDPGNEVLVFSGSEMGRLEETFGELPVWLAAENGVYVHPPKGHQDLPQAWKCLFDTLPKEWMESVQLVLDYFCERTPRSFVEGRDTSLVWNYKHADVEFGRLQARDLLQHLWTGPISNAPVEIIQGGRSVEVRPVGVTKGLAMQRIVGYMAQVMGRQAIEFDFVLCIGHLLARDENMYLLFEGEKLEGVSRAELRGSGHNSSNHAAGKPPLPLWSTLQNGTGNSTAGSPPETDKAEDPQQPLLSPHLLQQQYPLHAICELDEAAQQQYTGSSNASSAVQSAAGAVEVNGNGNSRRGNSAIGVGTHRLFGPGTGMPPGTASVDGMNNSSHDPSSSSSSSSMAADQHSSPAGVGPVTQDASVDTAKNSSGNAGQAVSPRPVDPAAAVSPSMADSLMTKEQEAAQQEAARQETAANASAGVYAAARTRRRQQQHQQQQQQQQQQLPGHVASSSVAVASGYDVQQQQPQQQQQPVLAAGAPVPQDQQALQRAMSPPLQQLIYQQQQVQQQQQAHSDSVPGGASPGGKGARHDRSSSSSTFAEGSFLLGNGMDMSSLGSGGSSSSSVNLSKMLKFPPKYLFTCSVGRSRSKARYSLAGSNDVGTLLEAIIRQGIQNLSPLGSTELALERQLYRDGTLGGLGSFGGSSGTTSSGGALNTTSGGGSSAVIANIAAADALVMRAIEAAAAARTGRERLQVERLHSSPAVTPGVIVSQGSNPGFAVHGSLIGPLLARSSTSDKDDWGEQVDESALSWHVSGQSPDLTSPDSAMGGR